jgi:methyltransferase (TIGR00027 family)
MNQPLFLAATISAFIEAILFPVMVVGYVLFVLRMLLDAGKYGSMTILASLYVRWVQHELGVRRDAPCFRLMGVLPYVSSLGLRLVSAPTLLAHRVSGYVDPVFRYPYEGVPTIQDQPGARTTFFDLALARHLEHIDQLVILGAGFDTRCYRLPPSLQVRCFEVDAAPTQTFKLQMLDRARIDARQVVFVSADFERDDWLARLLDSGFDPTRRTFFLWESVTMYLDPQAVESTLRRIASTAPGSAVAFDYFSTELLQRRSLLWSYARGVLRLIGEPFGTFGIDNTVSARMHAARLVERCGLTLEEQRNFGEESFTQRPAAGFLVATV